MEIRRISNDELYHHGIKGQKWGIRRFQNPDGSLKDAGKKRYITSTLKRNEKRYGEENSRRQINKEKYERLKNRARKAKEKGNADKAAALNAKSEKYKKLMNTSIKEMKAAESANWKTVAKAIEAGYDVDIHQGQGLYYSKKGRQTAFAAQFLGGILAGVGANIAMANDETGKYSTRINTYKVKKHKDAQTGNARIIKNQVKKNIAIGKNVAMNEAIRSSISANNTAVQLGQQAAQQAAQRAAIQASISAANQAASLAMTGGMNPFMFGP